MEINNGDIFDIGQTVNGVSRFIKFNDTWHYFEKRMTREYEYDQDDLTNTILNKSGLEEITFQGNIFDHIH
jgi:hypothetical protein